MTTIFWPTGLVQSGVLFGWPSPSICIAGVVEVGQEDSIDTLFTSQHDYNMQGHRPRLLGTYDGMHIDLFNNVEKPYTIIRYEPHSLRSMRFYRLDVLEFSSVPPTKDLAPDLANLHYSRCTQSASAMSQITIEQINHASDLWRSVRMAMTHQPKKSTSLSSVSQLTFPTAAISILSRTAYGSLSAIIHACHIRLTLPGFATYTISEYVTLVHQVGVRATQLRSLIKRVSQLYRRDLQPDLATFSIQYVNFYNSLWLILNDIILGIGTGLFLCENRHMLANCLQIGIEKYLVRWVIAGLAWLDSWPVGLKLNTELSRFYSQSFTILFVLWSRWLNASWDSLPQLVYALGLLSCGGLTFLIAALSDVLSLCTFHAHLCYMITITVYHRQLQTAASLWNLFRGKRYNVLRDRVDAWDYEVDQLLFGTILFTLVAFLFPTVLLYYLLFASMRLAIITAHANMETFLIFMNHFPLFALMLRIKDPHRLPGGMVIITHTGDGALPGLELQNQPVPLSSIFSQYRRLWSLMWKHYHPLRLLASIVRGKYLARHAVRYETATK